MDRRRLDLTRTTAPHTQAPAGQPSQTDVRTRRCRGLGHMEEINDVLQGGTGRWIPATAKFMRATEGEHRCSHGHAIDTQSQLSYAPPRQPPRPRSDQNASHTTYPDQNASHQIGPAKPTDPRQDKCPTRRSIAPARSSNPSAQRCSRERDRLNRPQAHRPLGTRSPILSSSK